MGVRVTHTEGLHFKATTSAGYSFEIDKTPEAGEPARGAGPMELLLLGLAGCTGMDIVSILEKSRQQVTGLEVAVDGVRAKDYPMVWTHIKVHYLIKGHEVSEEAVKRAIELSETKYCSALAMLRETAKVESSYRIEEAAPAQRVSVHA